MSGELERIWDVLLGDVQQTQNRLDENFAKQMKDRLLEAGNPSVTLQKVENGVRYRYIYKNRALAKKSFREDD